MKWLVLAILIALLLLPHSSFGQKGWQFVVESESGYRYYQERELSRKPTISSHLLVWEKQEIPPSKDPRVKGSIDLKEYDCQKRAYRMLETTTYFRNGHTEKTTYDDPFFQDRWLYPAAESVGEELLSTACKDLIPQPQPENSQSIQQNMSKWKLIIEDQDGVSWWYQLKQTGPMFRQVWVSTIQKSRPKSNSDMAYDQNLVEVSCADGKFRFLQITKFNAEGKVLFSKALQNDQWSYVLPDSIGATMLKAACEDN